ncbi:MAG: phenylalanyl-tRNA synthetase beta chain [Candidatus Paceibacteria bacterium]|jgi:phenylalanyl-tRNA synthetase beta chain
MLISRNWLQSYFTNELPDADTIANTLMLHAFEVEGVKNGVIDIDVLPNRAHDCLSHAGVAHEYAALMKLELKQDRYHYHQNINHDENSIKIAIENHDQCFRYIARRVSCLQVQESPAWLIENLAAIGQRSINNIVDATNYLMFDSGQPMHAFDADKIAGGITIRNAKEGEEMMTLTGEELVLTVADLVIADDEGVLALAGVKGGKKAEVDEDTTNVVIEVANFNPLTTRQTARRVKIQTDSSKRFENGITSELSALNMENISMLISDLGNTDNISLGTITDVYPTIEEKIMVKVTLNHIQKLLGLAITVKEVSSIFERLNYQYHNDSDIFEVHIPANRLDLRIAEDIIEEIGRIYGYHNIPVKNLDDYHYTPEINKIVYVSQTLRNFLISKGVNDVMTYTFVKKGDVEMFNPIASDKKALRKTLHKQLQEALEKNAHNSDFFGVDRVALFEIGRVYTKNGEQNICSIALHNVNKAAHKKYGTERTQLESLVEEITDMLKVEIQTEYHGNIVSFNLDSLEISETYKNLFETKTYSEDAVFHSISQYQFTTRDVSFWAPEGKSEAELRTTIMEAETDYLHNIYLFDMFEKEGKTSYAFSIVFQSNEKTLTDAEVDNDMDAINAELLEIGCDIR